MTETELEYQFCFNCNDRKQCYTKPKDCTRIQEEIGLQEMTNEEWLCGLSTEEKAKFLRQIYRDGRDDYIGEWYEQTEADFVEWLKQPHTTIRSDSMARECERCEELPKCEIGKDECTICCTEYKPKQPLTNGDFLRICSVDSLAEFLWSYTHDVIGDYERIRNPILRQMPLKNILGDNCTKKEAWVKWLKQPHTPKE